MPRRRKGKVSRVGPDVQFVIAEYIEDQSSKNDLRIREVQTLISEVILLARRRGRPKKEEELKYAV